MAPLPSLSVPVLLWVLLAVIPEHDRYGVTEAWIPTIPTTHHHQHSRRNHQPFQPLDRPSSSQQQQRRYQQLQLHLRRRIHPMSSLSSIAATTDGVTSSPIQHHPEITLYNSKTRSKQPFEPVDDECRTVSMYTCGPTVYDYAHIGNFRAFLTYDVLKRVLTEYCGYAVTHVCNLTDVDDKIIKRANEQQLTDITALTLEYEELFMDDLRLLNIVPATHYPRATDHIPEMMDMIMILAQKGLAYETSDGSWYFRTQSQPGYGEQLVGGLNFDEMEAQQTETDSESEKEHFADFCLWKAYKEGFDRMDAAWSSDEIRLGRPGWHLECSAMVRKFFGDGPIDLHGGGVDLKFPHHENEIAQSEGATGNTFCNCWFHNGFVNLDNEKMSKSLGNFLTLQTACPTALDIRAYRYLVVSSQYRNPLAFTPAAMKAAKNAVKRIDKIKNRMEQTLLEQFDDSGSGNESELADSVVPGVVENFEAAIRDDLSMPRAAAALFSLVKEAEGEFKRVAKLQESDEEEDSSSSASSLDLVGLRSILSAMERMDRIFGIFYRVPLPSADGADGSSEDGENDDDAEVPSQVVELVSQRSAAKEAKDWELADSLRTRIGELGFAVKDVKGGEPVISRIEN